MLQYLVVRRQGIDDRQGIISKQWSPALDDKIGRLCCPGFRVCETAADTTSCTFKFRACNLGLTRVLVGNKQNGHSPAGNRLGYFLRIGWNVNVLMAWPDIERAIIGARGFALKRKKSG